LYLYGLNEQVSYYVSAAHLYYYRKGDKGDKAAADAAAAAKKVEEELLAMEKGCVAHISGLTDANTQREDIKVIFYSGKEQKYNMQT
jgi:hypothetical protein